MVFGDEREISTLFGFIEAEETGLGCVTTIPESSDAATEFAEAELADTAEVVLLR